jgi:hypothetical protein
VPADSAIEDTMKRTSAEIMKFIAIVGVSVVVGVAAVIGAIILSQPAQMETAGTPNYKPGQEVFLIDDVKFASRPGDPNGALDIDVVGGTKVRFLKFVPNVFPKGQRNALVLILEGPLTGTQVRVYDNEIISR